MLVVGADRGVLAAASSQIHTRWQSLEEHEPLNCSRNTWTTIDGFSLQFGLCPVTQISACSRSFPDAFDRNDVLTSPPPTSDQLNYLAELRSGETPVSSVKRAIFGDVTVKTISTIEKMLLGGLVMQVRFERFSFNELQSSVLGHSVRTCIVLALQC